jgi:cell shape-determining protein MreC
MYCNTQKKHNFSFKKISFIIFFLLSLIIFTINIIQGEKFIKANFFLNKFLNYNSLNIDNLKLQIKKIKLNIDFLLKSIIISQDIFKNNEVLIDEVRNLKLENFKLLEIINQKKQVSLDSKNISQFDTLAGIIISNSTNEILIKSPNLINHPDELKNNIIYNKNGLIGRIKEVYILGDNLIIFGQKTNHVSFKIPIITKNGNIGIFYGKQIENLNSITNLNEGDEVFLMPQDDKIPENLKIGNIKKINQKNNSSAEIILPENKENLLGQNIFIFYKKEFDSSSSSEQK